MYSLIEKGQETLNGIMELAEETQSPRAYEVAGQLLKSVADTTDKFLKLQKDLKDIKEEQKGPTNVTNNAMFVGSTAELQKNAQRNEQEKMKELYEDDWYCSVNIGIDEVRAMYSHLEYSIKMWLVLLLDL